MSVPPEVRITDAALVQRALHNLVDNALAHGAVPVHVHVGRDGGTLTLRVRDRGPGVAEGALADLTRPYVRSTSGGTGLGLALVAFISQTLGGDLVLRNLQPGFEANLRLPIVVEERSAIAHGAR
jgi:signal transduction histidine kinase